MIETLDYDELQDPSGTPAAAREIELSNGAGARCVSEGGSERVEVYNEQKQLVFQFDPHTGKTTLLIPEGDLQLISARGNIELQAAGTVRTRGDEIDMRARRRIGIGIFSRIGRVLSRISLRDSRCTLLADDAEVQAKRWSMNADEISQDCQRLATTADSTLVRTRKNEVHADTIEETCKNSFRTVESLHQVKAGRLRMMVAGLLQFRSRKALMRAESDVTINGEKVNLG